MQDEKVDIIYADEISLLMGTDHESPINFCVARLPHINLFRCHQIKTEVNIGQLDIDQYFDRIYYTNRTCLVPEILKLICN